MRLLSFPFKSRLLCAWRINRDQQKTFSLFIGWGKNNNNWELKPPFIPCCSPKSLHQVHLVSFLEMIWFSFPFKSRLLCAWRINRDQQKTFSLFIGWGKNNNNWELKPPFIPCCSPKSLHQVHLVSFLEMIWFSESIPLSFWHPNTNWEHWPKAQTIRDQPLIPPPSIWRGACA